MKKFILLVVCCLFCIIDVKAENNDTQVRYEYIDNIYSNREVGESFYTGPQGIVYANGEVAYCLDPTTILNNEIYASSSDFSIYNISSEKLNYLEMISYFGYGYQDRTDSKYYLATQELIWEYIIESNIYWTNGKGGEIINIDFYKEKIINSIEEYEQKPNIPTYVETYQNEELILEDTNNALKYYRSNLWLGTIENNKLKLSTEYKGTSTVTLTKKPLTYKQSYIYLSDNSQTLATFGYTSDNTETIKVTYKVKAISKIRIIKKDLNTNKIIENNNLKIKIYDVERQTYIKENNSEIIVINESGIYESTIYLEEGEYLIEEIEAPIGYQKLDKPVVFNIYEYDGPIKEILIYNTPRYYNIEINKTGEILQNIEIENGIGEGKYKVESLNNIVYGLFSNDEYYDPFTDITYYKDDLIMEIKINDGYGISDIIPYGNYYLKEITYPEEYESTDPVNIEFNNEDDILTYNFVNKLKKGNIIIKKVNETTPLQGAEIKINDIILTSNEEGTIKLLNIPYNKYYLEEIKAPIGYKLDSEIKMITLESAELNYIFNNELLELPKEEVLEKDPEIEENPPVEEVLPKEEEKNPIEEDTNLEDKIENESTKEEIKNDEPIKSEENEEKKEEQHDKEEFIEEIGTVVENPNTSISKKNMYSYLILICLFILYKLKNPNLHSQ